MALALDGSTTLYGASGTSFSLTLTTADAGDVLILLVLLNGVGSTQTTITSVTGGLTWTHRATGGGVNSVQEWYAIAPAALSAQSFTFSLNQSCPYISAALFGISGANTTSPFDGNASLPYESNGGAAATISTTAANTFIIGGFRQNSVSGPTAGAGFTQLAGGPSGNPYFCAEYLIASSAQTNLSVGDSANSDTNGVVADAIVAASGVTATVPWPFFNMKAH